MAFKAVIKDNSGIGVLVMKKSKLIFRKTLQIKCYSTLRESEVVADQV